MIYPEFEASVVEEPWSAEFIRSLDVVVGIDPGIRNAGFSWTGFDRDLTAYVFDEGLLQDKTAAEYVEFIRATNARWGLSRVSYVVDPAAKQRAQANGMTVLARSTRLACIRTWGRTTMSSGSGRCGRGWLTAGSRCPLLVSGLRDEADEYAAKEPEEGKDDSYLEPIPGGAHRLDSLRYGVLERFWDPVMEEQAPLRQLGFDPSRAMPAEAMRVPMETAPLGFMS
jgi:hypothetical protein